MAQIILLLRNTVNTPEEVLMSNDTVMKTQDQQSHS